MGSCSPGTEDGRETLESRRSSKEEEQEDRSRSSSREEEDEDRLDVVGLDSHCDSPKPGNQDVDCIVGVTHVLWPFQIPT